MKKYLLLAVTALVGLAAISCEEVEIVPDDAINLEGTTITVGKDAVTQTVTFTAPKTWTAESDSQWIVLDQTSGEAGEITLKLAIAENDTWAERSGKVTVTVGEVKTVFTVVQKTVSVFETAFTFNIGPKAQDIVIPVNTNVEYTVTPASDSPWITVTSTKAAPQEGNIKVHVAANTDLGPRTGSFTIAAPGYSQTYTVVQAADWTPAVTAEAIYISNSQYPYNPETWGLTTQQQYVVILETEEGDVVTLVLNKNPEEGPAPVDVIPSAEYEIDATGTYADNTFSILSSTGKEKYFTGIISEGRSVIVYDGAITVEEADGVYTITAILVDAAGIQHNYSYVGAIELGEEFFVGSSAEVNWKNTYDTHFTTKANGWAISFYMPRVSVDGDSNVAYASFSFYSEAGDVDLNSLPVGTFTYAEVAADADLKYSQGIQNADPGVLSSVSISLYGTDGLQYTTVDPASTKLTIAKNADGTYNIKYAATVTPYSYDDNWNVVNGDPVNVSIDIDVTTGKVTDTMTHPADDADVAIVSLDGAAGTVYVGYWYSTYIGGVQEDGAWVGTPAIEGTPCNVFSFGSNSYFNGAWSVMLAVIADADWTYEKNFSGRYCSTPIPSGTYTFGTEAKIGALIPLRYNTASRCYATNTYTGTQYYPVAGTVVLTDNSITLDITCKTTEATLVGRPNSPETITLKGSTPYTCYYLQDYSAGTRVRYLNITPIVSLD